MDKDVETAWGKAGKNTYSLKASDCNDQDGPDPSRGSWTAAVVVQRPLKGFAAILRFPVGSCPISKLGSLEEAQGFCDKELKRHNGRTVAQWHHKDRDVSLLEATGYEPVWPAIDLGEARWDELGKAGKGIHVLGTPDVPWAAVLVEGMPQNWGYVTRVANNANEKPVRFGLPSQNAAKRSCESSIRKLEIQITGSKQRKTLERVFADPTPSDILWTRIESLFNYAGCTIEYRGGSRVIITKNTMNLFLHRPHPGNQTPPSTVKEIRTFLTNIGVTP